MTGTAVDSVVVSSFPVTVSNLKAGTYSFVFKTSKNCTASLSNIQLQDPNAPAKPMITAVGSTTFCNGDQVVLTSSATTGNVWSTGESTQSITVKTAGTYTVKVVTNGCTSLTSTATQVSVNPSPEKPTITASGVTSICAGSSVTLTAATTSTGSGSYTWTPSNTGVVNGSSLTVSSAGTFYATYKDENGCVSSTSVGTLVEINPNPTLTQSSLQNPTTCGGTDGKIVFGGTETGKLYMTGTAVDSVVVSSFPVTVSNLKAGAYSFVFKTSKNCTASLSNIQLQDPNAPAKPMITAVGSTTFCNGDQVVLTSSATTGNVWSTGESTQSITVKTAGAYTVKVVTNGCTSLTSTATQVSVNPSPEKPTITASGATSICAGSSVTLTAATTSTGSGSYTWTPSNTGVVNGSSLTVSSAGTFYATYKDENGCVSATSVGTLVEINPNPTLTQSSLQNPTTCGGTDGKIVFGGTETGKLYMTGTAVDSVVVSSFPVTVSNLKAGTYSFVFKTSKNCTASLSNIQLQDPNAPAKPMITAVGSTTFCNGDQVVLTSSATTGNVWSTGESTQSITVKTAGAYTVKVVINGCTSLTSTATQVSVNPSPEKPTITASGATSICAGSSVTLTASISSTEAGIYTWVPAGLGVVAGANFTATVGGTYAVTFTDVNGCVSLPSQGMLVTVNPTPVLTQGILTTPSTCGGTNGSIELKASATGNGNSTLSWTGAASGVMTVTTSPYLLQNFKAGIYTFVLTTAQNCAATLSNVVLNDPNAPNAPTVSVTGNLSMCSGDQVVLTSSEANGNSWSTGETTQSITVKNAGNYAVVVTKNGCMSNSSAIQQVVLKSKPSATIFEGANVAVCMGSSLSLSTSSTQNQSYQWFLNGAPISGATGNTYSVMVSNAVIGGYSVEVTNEINGCKSVSASSNVSVGFQPTALTNAPLFVCQSNATQVDVTGTPNAVVYYTIDNGSAANTLFLDTYGKGVVYTFPITTQVKYNFTKVANSTDAESCAKVLNQEVIIQAKLLPNASIASINPVCYGSQGLVAVSGTPNAKVYYTLSNGGLDSTILGSNGIGNIVINQVVSNLNVNLVKVIAVDGITCGKTLNVSSSIPVLNQLQAHLTAPKVICENGSVDVSVQASANSSVTYTINGGTEQILAIGSSGEGLISLENLNNSTTVSVTNITSASSVSCSQTLSKSITIDVIPTNMLTNSDTMRTICSGEKVQFTPSTTLQGLNYDWYETTASGQGQSNSNPINLTLTNSGDVAKTFNYLIQPKIGQCSGKAITLTVKVNPILNADFDYKTICGDASFVPSYIAKSGGLFTLVNSSSTTVKIDASTGLITNYLVGEKYIVSYQVGFCNSKVTKEVVSYAIPSTPKVSGKSTYCSVETLEPLSVIGEGSIFEWTTDTTETTSATDQHFLPNHVIGTQTYFVRENNNGCKSTWTSLSVTINNCELNFHSAFTPNKDGVNDTWEIAQLDKVYPKNVVTIYQRNGEPVFQSDLGNYNSNSWDGKFQGEYLPIASYYYVIELNDGTKKKITGTVTIIK